MNRLSEFVARVRGEREAIWSTEPPEVARLKSIRKGLGGRFPARFYALSDTYRNQRNLWMFRDMAARGEPGLEALKAVLRPFFVESRDRFRIWALDRAAELFEQGARILESVQERDGLISLLEELLLYNNRLWMWLDASVPWFQLDERVASSEPQGGG